MNVLDALSYLFIFIALGDPHSAPGSVGDLGHELRPPPRVGFKPLQIFLTSSFSSGFLHSRDLNPRHSLQGNGWTLMELCLIHVTEHLIFMVLSRNS